MTSEILMTIGNSFFLIGTTLLSLKVLKNRNMLNDFDFKGSVLTFFGTVFMAVYLLNMQAFLSFTIAIPTIVLS